MPKKRNPKALLAFAVIAMLNMIVSFHGLTVSGDMTYYLLGMCALGLVLAGVQLVRNRVIPDRSVNHRAAGSMRISSAWVAVVLLFIVLIGKIYLQLFPQKG